MLKRSNRVRRCGRCFRLVDPADKRQLYPYDDGGFWYLVKYSSLTLGEVAHAALTEDLDKFKKWIRDGEVDGEILFSR